MDICDSENLLDECGIDLEATPNEGVDTVFDKIDTSWIKTLVGATNGRWEFVFRCLWIYLMLKENWWYSLLKCTSR